MPLVSKNSGKVERTQGAKCEYSKSSQILFFQILDQIDSEEHKEVFFAMHNDEFKLRKSFYDFKYRNKLIEFDGNFFHADPRIYSPESKIMAHKAKDIWAKDAEKDHLAREEGYQILRIWEDSYLKEPIIVLEKCLNFIFSYMRRDR